MLCGEALVDYLRITRRAADVMLPLEAQEVMDAILRYLNLYNEADLSLCLSTTLWSIWDSSAYGLGTIYVWQPGTTSL